MEQKSERIVLKLLINTRQSQCKRGSLTVLTVLGPSSRSAVWPCWEPSEECLLAGRDR